MATSPLHDPARDALVLQMLAAGDSHQAIADALGVSRQRVGVIVSRLRAQPTSDAPQGNLAPITLYTTPLQVWMDSVPLDAPTDDDRALHKSAVDNGSEEEPAWHAAKLDGVRSPLKTLKARMRLTAAGAVPAPPAEIPPGTVPTHKLIRNLMSAASDVMQWGASQIPELERAAAAVVERNNQYLDPLAAEFVVLADSFLAGAQAMQRERARAAQAQAQLQAALSGKPALPTKPTKTPEQEAADREKLRQVFAATFGEWASDGDE